MGDFNGDGLLVSLSTSQGYKWITLSVDNWDKSYPGKNYVYFTPVMGIGSLVPETYRRYVTKAHMKSEEGDPNEEDYKNPAIDFFRFESSGSFFYWSQSEKKFKRFWYSD